ncbi:MAG: flagellar protein FlgN [Thermoanaerobacteraceae bacterium]|nr:flagellar protein FlgN [Thermoanaerobacteraceae bacterium]
MERLFKHLRELLVKQNEIIEELIALGERETEALKENDIKNLAQIVREQEQVGVQLAEMEKERLALQEELAAKLPAARDAGLKDILRMSALSHTEELEQLADKLKENYRQLQVLNETNKLLIRQSLSYVNKILSVLTPQEEKTYHRSGMVKQKTATSTIDRTV